jgi:hypothetical protein
MLFLYLKQNRALHTADELAEATEDLKSNVIKNMHVFVSEGIVRTTRNNTTGVVRYTINEELLQVLCDLFLSEDKAEATEAGTHSRLKEAEAVANPSRAPAPEPLGNASKTGKSAPLEPRSANLSRCYHVSEPSTDD